MNQNLLSVEEIAKVLNVPPSWIYSRTRETGPESIPRIKVGKYIRFQREEVIDWLRAQDKIEEVRRKT
jgi:excisionase family DNA binding protein